MNGDKPKLDAKQKALTYGPKKPNKFMIWANKFKKKGDQQPGLKGYYCDKDENLFAVSIWKNISKEEKVYFSGSMEDLAVKQNIVDMPKKEASKDTTLDDDIPY